MDCHVCRNGCYGSSVEVVEIPQPCRPKQLECPSQCPPFALSTIERSLLRPEFLFLSLLKSDWLMKRSPSATTPPAAGPTPRDIISPIQSPTGRIKVVLQSNVSGAAYLCGDLSEYGVYTDTKCFKGPYCEAFAGKPYTGSAGKIFSYIYSCKP